MNSDIKDSVGTTILPLSIVEITERQYPYHEFQGMVVAPHSPLEGDGYTVAVYFFTEVHHHHFNYRERGTLSLAEWDEKFTQDNKQGNGEFLLKDDMWKQSPRIVFFKPKELLVQKCWNVKTLAKRFFPRTCRTINDFKEGLPRDPTAYTCFIEKCDQPASEIAVYNVWGSVFPLYVCRTCMTQVNGTCGDDTPSIKRPFLSRDGKQIVG